MTRKGIAAAVTAFTILQTALNLLTPLSAQPTVTSGSSYDFIIVGGGIAGSVIANKLTDNENTSVLLIEAKVDPPAESVVSTIAALLKSWKIPGIFSRPPHTSVNRNLNSVDKGYTAQDMKNQVDWLIAGMMLEESSSLHHLIPDRSASYDFDSSAKRFEYKSRSYDNILKYVMKNKKKQDKKGFSSKMGSLHTTTKYLDITRKSSSEKNNVLKAFAEIGHEIVSNTNSNNMTGYRDLMVDISDDLQQGGAQYIHVAKNRTNLQILTGTQVTKVLTENGKAVGVEAIKNEEIQIFNARVKVILCAEALTNPQLLARSGIRPKEHSEALRVNVLADMPVAQNLENHPVVIIVIKLDESDATAKVSVPHKFPVPVTLGHVALDDNQRHLDYQTINLLFPHDSTALLEFCSVIYSSEDTICQAFYDSSVGRNTLITVHSLLRPVFRGQVLKSTVYEDASLVSAGIYSTESDLNDMAKYLADFVKILNSTYFKNINAEIVDLRLKECVDHKFGDIDYWRCYALRLSLPMWHYSSTCSMGSLVDRRRIKRDVTVTINGKRIADANIAPHVVSGNPVAVINKIEEGNTDIFNRSKNVCQK